MRGDQTQKNPLPKHGLEHVGTCLDRSHWTGLTPTPRGGWSQDDQSEIMASSKAAFLA